MKTTEKTRPVRRESVSWFETGDLPQALAGHGAGTRLSDLPLECLPPALQQTCEAFIDEWWASLDPDQPLQASGRGEMTLADLLAYHDHRKRAIEHPSTAAASTLSSVE
jgi:hypothetical protein